MTQQQTNKSFMGRGWKFPPQFVKSGTSEVLGASVLMVAEEEDIKESLIILLSTRMRERVMRSDYGCNLDTIIFDSMTVTFLTMLRDHVEQCIRRYEPRIDLQAVVMDTRSYFEGKLLISVDYIISSVNKRDNIVYPFYLKEGTNVERSAFPGNL
jgi:uncharacterized protein